MALVARSFLVALLLLPLASALPPSGAGVTGAPPVCPTTDLTCVPFERPPDDVGSSGLLLGHYAIETPEEWARTWAQHTAGFSQPIPPPPVDFATSWIAITVDFHTTCCHQRVRIQEVHYHGTYTVSYLHLHPAVAGSLDAIWAPFDLVIVDRVAPGPVAATFLGIPPGIGLREPPTR